MRDIKLTLTTTCNPIDYAREQLKVVDGQYVARLVQLSVDNNENDVKASVKSINCKLRNVQNVKAFTRLVQVTFYKHSLGIAESRVSTLENAEIERDLTKNEQNELSLTKSVIIPSYQELVKLATPEEMAFISTDTFLNCVVATITGDFSVAIRNGASLNNVLAKLSGNAPTKELQTELTNYTLKITGEKDKVYNGYNLNCNSSLCTDVKARYYKGRKYSGSGNVTKAYDTNGQLVRKEIMLAIVEDLQKKEEQKK